MKTIVYQSQARAKIRPWIKNCMESVQAWADHIGADYQFLDDDLFEFIPESLARKFKGQPVILADLARLRLMQAGFKERYDRVIWLDADVLVFDKEGLALPAQGHAVGREVWVQISNGKLRTYNKIHNAFLMAMSGDSFLPFYADTAERLLNEAVPPLVPQFIGPKFLTAQNNISRLSVLESVGMLSPLALSDINAGGGEGLALTLAGHQGCVAAFNLAASYVGKPSDGVCNHEPDYEQAVERLLTVGLQG